MSSQPPRVAIFGLGIIGSRAADRLAAAGVPLVTWNRTRQARPDAVDSPAAAARAADLLCFYLKDSQAVREVLTEILPELRPGHVVVNHSTVDLAATRWLADCCAQSKVGFLDAPFTGSRLAAENGGLVYYVGGDPALLESVRPVLEITSSQIVHVGPHGHATVVKLVTNLIAACLVEALAEALAIASRHGVASDRLVAAVEAHGSHSPLVAYKLGTMLAGDFTPHFSLANMLKDSRYALELARDAGLDTPAIDAVSSRMADLCARGWGQRDFAVLAEAFGDLHPDGRPGDLS